MGRIRWYKRDPRAALTGMAKLALEERGAYNTVLDLIYVNDGAVDDDPRYIAGWLGVDVRVWKRIRTSLIRQGKLYTHADKLRNERADQEVLVALDRVASAAHAGLMSAAKRAEQTRILKSLDGTGAQRPFNVLTSRKIT